MLDAADGLHIWSYGSGVSTNLLFRLKDISQGATSDLYTDGGSSSILLYCTIARSGTTLTCDFYSDSAFNSVSHH